MSRKWRNKSLYLFFKLGVLLTAIFIVKNFCKKQTEDFSIASINSERSFNPEWEVHSLSSSEEKELHKALDQKYTYLISGGQSFIFFSEDQKYVVKFFKQRFYQLPFWLKYIPLPRIFHLYRAKKKYRRGEKLKRDFRSYQMAFDELKEETGLIYVHLNKTNFLNKKLIIKDRLNIEHQLDLDAFDFIIQKKAELVYDHIHQAMLRKDLDAAKKTITEIVELIINYSKKGYLDRDPNLGTNCGLLGTRAILIDIGKLIQDETMKEPENYAKTLVEICASFHSWLQQLDPSLAMHLKQEISKQTDS